MRNARANAPKYHPEIGTASEDIKNPTSDVPSRQFAGTLRYSIDFLVEVNLRDGRRSHGRNKGTGAQQANPSTAMDTSTVKEESKTPPLARTNLDYADAEPTFTPLSSGKASGSDLFKNWIRSRLVKLDIEPYTPGEPKQDQGTEDLVMTPSTPSPGHILNRKWDNTVRSDRPSTMPDRTKRSLESALRQVERSPSEKAANVAKIRNSDRWR